MNSRSNRIACSSYLNILVISIFVVLGFAAYSSNLYGGFVLDGQQVIGQNRVINPEVWNLEAFQSLFLYLCEANRPVAMGSFAFNYFFFGDSVFSFHIFNILIHIVTGLGIFVLFRQTLFLDSTRQVSKKVHFSVAFFSALFWLVHPLNSQAVNYLVQRMTLLAVFCFVWSLVIYLDGRIRYVQRGCSVRVGCQFLLSFGFFILGMGSKTIVISLPAVLVLYELLFFQKVTLRKFVQLTALSLLGVVVILVGYSYWRGNILVMLNQNYNNYDGDLSRSTHFLTECRVVIYYLRQFFIPDISLMRLEYDFPLSRSLFSPISTFFSGSLLVFLLVTAVKKFLKNRIFALAIFWFLGTLALESFIIKLDLVYEHRMYLGSILLPLPIVACLFKYMNNRKILYMLLCLLTGLFTTLTYQRSKVWRSPLEVYKSNLKLEPTHSRLLLNYFREEANNWDGAPFPIDQAGLQLIEQDIKERMNNRPDSLKYYDTLQALYFIKKEPVKAKAVFEYYMANADDEKSKNRMQESYAYGMMINENYSEAIRVYLHLLETTGQHKLTYAAELAKAYSLTKQSEQADKVVSKYIRLFEEQPALLKYLGYFYLRQRDFTRGKQLLEKYYKFVPEDKQAAELLKLL